MSKRIKTALKKPLKCQTLVLKQHVLLFMFYAYPPKQKKSWYFFQRLWNYANYSGVLLET